MECTRVKIAPGVFVLMTNDDGTTTSITAVYKVCRCLCADLFINDDDTHVHLPHNHTHTHEPENEHAALCAAPI